MEPVTREAALNLLRNTKGRFFSVLFKKKDNTDRFMVARIGVKKHLVGGELPYDPKQYDLLPVYDVAIASHRMVNLSTLSSFKCGGKHYKVQS